MKYETLANQLADSIQSLASKPENLNNFVSYLTYHFDTWLKMYANTPEGLASELKEFSNMTW